MTMLEEPNVGAKKVRTEPDPPGERPSRFARYFTRSGWVHILLLMFVWLFFFPFLWMLFTSVKTDDELPDAAIVPRIPTFTESSPYVRAKVNPVRPVDVEPARWAELLPKLQEVAAKRVGEIQARIPRHDTFTDVDPGAHRQSAASVLVNYAVGKLNKELWKSDEPALFRAYGEVLDDDSVHYSLRESLATLELLSFQLRTLDFHIHTLTTGPQFATTWKIESGPAKLLPTDAGTLLSYHFPSSSSDPIVLSHPFTLPDGVLPADLHKLIVAVKSDDSWHGVNAELHLAGKLWRSTRTTYLAQHRAMSFIFQPPTFDDQQEGVANEMPEGDLVEGALVVANDLAEDSDGSAGRGDDQAQSCEL